MLTFLVRCTRCWCSATARMWGRGWGGVGHVNVPCTLHTLLMFRNCQDVGQGLGWGGACQRSLYVAHVVDVPQLPGCGAGAGVGWGMLTFLVRCTRCWCSATARMWGRGWGGVGHVNVPCTLHTLLHTVLSPIVSELVLQWAWRQHQGPMLPTQFFTALQRLLKHWKNGTKRR